MEPLEEAVPERLAQAEIDTAVSVARRITQNIRKAVQVRDEILEHLTVTMLSEGHILVEDYPGVGKTALARALSRSIDCQFARVQCTADLLPADIIGTQIYNQRESRFEFRPGPIFANVVLVDEINRASPKTQSGLLECMQERQVTVEATSHELARPFLVFATQNPVEYEGTYPLPEAQLDRFAVKMSIGYPPLADEARMLAEQTGEPPLDLLVPVAGREELVDAIAAARDIFVEESVNRYVVALLRHTRGNRHLALGASPRSGIALLRLAKARALVERRTFVTPDDIREMATPVLSHRLLLAPEARSAGLGPEDVVREALEGTPVPV
jgi:MoxR-like ATPase